MEIIIIFVGSIEDQYGNLIDRSEKWCCNDEYFNL